MEGKHAMCILDDNCVSGILSVFKVNFQSHINSIFFSDVDFESSKAVPVFCMTLSGHCVDSAAVGNIYLS